MSKSTKKAVELMQNALDEYKMSANTAKLYFNSMKEISSWLAQKEK